MKPTKEQIDELAREMCFYSDNDLGCAANCSECFGYYWRKYKLPAKKVAEKWDKIGTRQELVCHREDNWGNLCDDKWCEKCDKKDLVGITRQEAIERMAKGMYLLTNPEDTKYADFYNCYFFELAEAALNALLGE